MEGDSCTVVGEYNGFAVVVRRPADAIQIYNLGHFGKGSLSRSQPLHCATACGHENSSQQENIWSLPGKVWRWARRHIISIFKKPLPTRGLKRSVQEMQEDANIPAERHISQVTDEVLCLLPEEAFYLFSVLHKLQVLFNTSVQTEGQLWEQFSNGSAKHLQRGVGMQWSGEDGWITCPRQWFFSRYKVYHHFRRLGWVVRHGLEFGVDFLLYSGGPDEVHATFGVLLIDEPLPNWLECMRWVRLAETVAKGILMCQVRLPQYCLSAPGQTAELDDITRTVMKVTTEASGRLLVPLAKVRQVHVSRYKGNFQWQATAPSKRQKVR